MSKRLLAVVAVLAVCGAVMAAGDDLPDNVPALKSLVQRLRMQIRQKDAEIAALKARVQVLAASQPASGPAAASRPAAADHAARRRQAIARIDDSRNNGWLAAVKVGEVGRIASRQARVLDVLSETEAVVSLQTVEVYLEGPRFPGGVAFEQERKKLATVLLTGVDTTDWADGAEVEIKAVLWISGTKKIAESTYFVAEPIE
jgi:hypothetical protein